MVVVLASGARPQLGDYIRMALYSIMSQLAIFGHCTTNFIKSSGDCIRKGGRSGVGGSCTCGFLPAPTRSVQRISNDWKDVEAAVMVGLVMADCR